MGAGHCRNSCGDSNLTQIVDIYRDRLPASVFIRWYQDSRGKPAPHYLCRACNQWVCDWDDRGWMDLNGQKLCNECQSKTVQVQRSSIVPVIDPGYADAKFSDYEFFAIRAIEGWPVKTSMVPEVKVTLSTPWYAASMLWS